MLWSSRVPVICCVLAAAPVKSADFSPVEALLEEAVRAGAFPGCAAVVGTERETLWAAARGRFDGEGSPAATTRSLYDLASLTKVVGTTSVVLALVRDGRISLADAVAKHLPEFRGDGREDVTVEHLLTHASGLPAWRPLYKEAGSREDLVRRVLETPLEAPPGTRTVYSDLGFILLGEVAAAAGGAPLPELERRLLLDPLGLRDTTRDPSPLGLDRVVPTERIRPVRGVAGIPAEAPAEPPAPLRGVVHDENAQAGGGATGHAGLFSTAEDLAVFARELLRGRAGASRVFPRDVLERFTTRRGLVAGSSRALGWDTPSPGSSAGSLLGPNAFGHTGFTGTSLWVDPDRGIYVLLLSNRVYPTRENLRILRVRRDLADLVVLALEGRVRAF